MDKHGALIRTNTGPNTEFENETIDGATVLATGNAKMKCVQMRLLLS